MILKKTHSVELAAAKASFSRATGYRLAADPAPPLQEKKLRGLRRPDPLADIFDTVVVPVLENSPGIRSVGLFEELMRRHPELGPGVRRTLARREWSRPKLALFAFVQHRFGQFFPAGTPDIDLERRACPYICDFRLEPSL